MRKNGLLLCLLSWCFVLNMFGQSYTKDDIKLDYKKSYWAGKIVVNRIENKSLVTVKITLLDETNRNARKEYTLRRGQTWTGDITCTFVGSKSEDGKTRVVLYKTKGTKEVSQPKSDTLEERNITKPDSIGRPSSDTVKAPAAKISASNADKRGQSKHVSNPKNPTSTTKKTAKEQDQEPNYFKQFEAHINSLFKNDSIAIHMYIDELDEWNDKNAYIREKKLTEFINNQHDTLTRYQNRDSLLVAEFINKYPEKQRTALEKSKDSLTDMLDKKLEQLELNLSQLEEKVANAEGTHKYNVKTILVGAGTFLLFVIFCIWYMIAQKKTPQKKTTIHETRHRNTESGIRLLPGGDKPLKLRKQNLDDVIDNDAYLKIETKEICESSMVRNIYLKNTCIKDIYTMYAEDLRNPNNPKEDGCMVLGRWVQDEDSKKYDVSLEYIITPGDDAVFSEYELNFGGKIKLKMAEKLRNLRQTTDLQYDLTCWVHSHPGLGVFFSNYDENVHEQLKHPIHPGFLTAMVVDILTPLQDTGIFTFKPDASINAKQDIKRIYSLDEMYRWAVESERKSFNAADYFNVLSNAKSRDDECYGIELSNGAVIDIDSFVTSGCTNFGFIHGFPIQQKEKTECVVRKLGTDENNPENELMGCFIVSTHCSIPSIGKTVARYLGKIKFVTVYTQTDGVLTTIPVIHQELCSDEKYYGEHKLEDLKVWTRRRR